MSAAARAAGARSPPPRLAVASLLALSASLLLAASGCRRRETMDTRDAMPRERGPADLVLHSGKIWTGERERPEVEALAARGERIVAIGSNEEVLPLAGGGARVIDLAGRRVVPGLADSHVHFLEGGAELLAPDLRSARSARELARRLGEVARSKPEGAWVVHGTWDHENWPGAPLPTRRDIDEETRGHPVLVSRLDGHMALANSLALDIAQVTRETPDPPGGTIVREARTGEPTGVLKDEAMALVARHVPAPSHQELLERARVALRHATSLGITGFCDMLGSLAEADLYRELLERGELTARVTLYAPIGSLEVAAARKRRGDLDGPLLRLAGVKAFADGSLGSSTALFFDPYLDDPSTRGLAVADLAPAGELERRIAAAWRAGLQPATHAIGDRANREVLDLYERLESLFPGGAASRPPARIEHAQHLSPADIPRFARLGVIASMQPWHAIDDGRWAEKRIGAARAETTYAFRDLLDSGATLAFGSDWPVAPLTPLGGIEAAATRATLDGKHPGGWVPRQKITPEEALRAYTAGAAAAAGRPDSGKLLPGRLADLVVLERDILAIPPEEIGETKVALTIVGGRIVHEAKANPAKQ